MKRIFIKNISIREKCLTKLLFSTQIFCKSLFTLAQFMLSYLLALLCITLASLCDKTLIEMILICVMLPKVTKANKKKELLQMFFSQRLCKESLIKNGKPSKLHLFVRFYSAILHCDLVYCAFLGADATKSAVLTNLNNGRHQRTFNHRHRISRTSLYLLK